MSATFLAQKLIAAEYSCRTGCEHPMGMTASPISKPHAASSLYSPEDHMVLNLRSIISPRSHSPFSRSLNTLVELEEA